MLESLGVETYRIYDVGVADIHRLFAKDALIRRSDVLIAVAGMEGALPSVLGGLYPQPIIAEGAMYGEIIDTPRGDGGFGYDPYFLLPEYGQTGAEISMELKNKISHRGKALSILVEKLKGER